MKFDKARDLVKFLLAMCIVLCLAGIATSGSSAGGIAALLSAVFFVMAFVVIIAFCRCPHCGKRIYLGLFKAVNCPKCRRNLITGVKSKGKKH